MRDDQDLTRDCNCLDIVQLSIKTNVHIPQLSLKIAQIEMIRPITLKPSLVQPHSKKDSSATSLPTLASTCKSSAIIQGTAVCSELSRYNRQLNAHSNIPIFGVVQSVFTHVAANIYAKIYWNKRTRLHNERVQLPQDWWGTPPWPRSSLFFFCNTNMAAVTWCKNALQVIYVSIKLTVNGRDYHVTIFPIVDNPCRWPFTT